MEKNLLNNVSEMTKVKIRFPNESIYDEISINLNDFKVDKEFDDEIYGWYQNTYVSLKK
jgi:hypothetical protein